MLLKQCVVIGAGMAGLLHARVLADFADEVTIIDRDHMPDQPEPRSGVPQGPHIHYLMARGLQVLDTLFPGIEDALRDSGAPQIKIGLHTRYMLYQQWQPSVDAGLHTYVAERPLLEEMVRQRVLALPNVTLVERTEATGLTFADGRVNGVVTRTRPAHGDPVTLPADLVVDASGRDGKVLDWLAAAGYPAPATTTVDAKLGYATRWYAKPDDPALDWRILYILTSPPAQTRGGGILEHRNGRWLVTLLGTNGDYPPTDDDEFLAFARSLPDPAIYDAICAAQPQSSIHSFRNTANRWRSFEKLDHQPDGLFVTGDAACEVNPVYGQGVTKAALNALALQELLAAGEVDNRAFYRKIAKINLEFWQTAAYGDLNYPGTTSSERETPVQRLMRAYVSAVLFGTTRDPKVTYAFHRVLNMVDPATNLMKPDILLRVLRAQRAAQ